MVVPQMSFPPSFGPLGRLSNSLPAIVARLRASACGLAFWTAIALPLGYLPLFILDVGGLSIEMLVGLLVAHVVVLVVGHSYQQ
ncbi:hypothetical protein [Halohasta salina]|uniref:hypothetical protein n=1 Tax=Halohasta salina TaxID=2961621 RepID=UPI0020A5B3B3|nr:hypothetical protein [Halohasta salina]